MRERLFRYGVDLWCTYQRKFSKRKKYASPKELLFTSFTETTHIFCTVTVLFVLLVTKTRLQRDNHREWFHFPSVQLISPLFLGIHTFSH